MHTAPYPSTAVAHPPRRLLRAGILGLCGLLPLGDAVAGPVSDAFRLTGDVVTPGRWDLDALTALPATTQSVSYLSGSSAQTREYTGTDLWGLLATADIRTDPAVKNDLLRKYVTAIGSDGYRAVFALGELSPDFGARGSIVAYAEDMGGTPRPLGADGFARVTAPRDVRGGRYVSNLVGLDVRGVTSTQTGSGGGVSGAFSISGLVNNAINLDAAALGALGLTWRTVDYDGTSYGGYLLWDLLTGATGGLATDPDVKNDVLGLYVVATGSDGYQAIFSMGELNPDFGNQPNLVALTRDGVDLADDGFARIVAPGDVRRGRWVSNLIGLEVYRAAEVPAPPVWALLGAGSVLLGGPRRRAPAAAEPAAQAQRAAALPAHAAAHSASARAPARRVPAHRTGTTGCRRRGARRWWRRGDSASTASTRCRRVRPSASMRPGSPASMPTTTGSSSRASTTTRASAWR